MNRAERRRAERASAPPAPNIAVIVCHNGQTRASFAFCLMRMMVAETCRTGMPPGVVWLRYGSDQLVQARNDSVKFFLDHYPETEWALFIDADMGFPADTIERLVAAADPVRRPVVGGLCFALKRGGPEDPATQAVRYKTEPTVYTFHDLEDDAGFLAMKDYPRDQLVQVAATGMALVLVHRSVLEEIQSEHGDSWFDRIPNPKKATLFGEDMSFCVRVAGCGVPIFVDTSVKTSHDKEGVFLTEERYDEQRRAVA